MIGTDNRPRPGAHIKLVWDRTRDGGNRLPYEPPGLTEWDFRFLSSIARYPLPLSPTQKAILKWIASRAA
jgi:hypothetical protein